MLVLAIFILLIFGYSLFSRKLDQRNLTPPIVFTLAGCLTGALMGFRAEDPIQTENFLMLAELGLVMLLFSDGTHIKQAFVGGFKSLPVRLLSIGMLLTIGLGMIVAMLVFGTLSVWEAGILAAILAPTDAGLGQAIVTNPLVPERIRTALNVEAGLNDGLAVPFLLFFIGMVVSFGDGTQVSFHRFLLEQLGYGTVIGIVVGGVGARLYSMAVKRGWIESSFRQIGVVALPAICMVLAEESGASMFIAAFVAGLVAQTTSGELVAEDTVEFIESWGQLINLIVFYLFGLSVAMLWSYLEFSHFLYGVLSLTVVRMVPVAISMIGTGLKFPTVVFMGWFGPRGLASIVLGLVYLEKTHDAAAPTIELAVIATVLMSIIAHGLMANPGARRYARSIADSADGNAAPTP